MAMPPVTVVTNWQIYVTHVPNACSMLCRIHVQYCHKISHILHYDNIILSYGRPNRTII